MNIGLIGPGEIGSVIVIKLRDAGYPVKMANSRGPESLKDLAAKPVVKVLNTISSKALMAGGTSRWK